MTVEQAGRIARALEVDPLDVMPLPPAPDSIRLRAFREPEVEAWRDPPAATRGHNDRAAADGATLLAALAPGVRNPALFAMRSRALEHDGVQPGDLLAVDLDVVAAEPGALVCAQVYDWKAGTAETVFRRWEPPYLISSSGDRLLARPLVVDGENVAIKGIVTGILRRTV